MNKKIRLMKAIVLMTAFGFSVPAFPCPGCLDGNIQISKKTALCLVGNACGCAVGVLLSCFPCTAPFGHGLIGFTAGADTTAAVHAVSTGCQTGQQIQPAAASTVMRIDLPPPHVQISAPQQTQPSSAAFEASDSSQNATPDTSVAPAPTSVKYPVRLSAVHKWSGRPAGSSAVVGSAPSRVSAKWTIPVGSGSAQ